MKKYNMSEPYNKQKGMKGEREMAEWMGHVSGEKYRRVPLSGALHQDFPFDVMKVSDGDSCFDKVGNESKNTKRLNMSIWIEQIEAACEDAFGTPNQLNDWFIYFKKGGKPYVTVPRHYLQKLLIKAYGNNDIDN